MPRSNFREIFLWMFRRRSRMKVVGDSMQPILINGQEVLLDRRKKRLRVGDIAVVEHPYKDMRLIKRISAYHDSGEIEIEGVNDDESTDSRTLGKIPMRLVVGRVTSVL